MRAKRSRAPCSRASARVCVRPRKSACECARVLCAGSGGDVRVHWQGLACPRRLGWRVPYASARRVGHTGRLHETMTATATATATATSEIDSTQTDTSIPVYWQQHQPECAEGQPARGPNGPCQTARAWV
jgi:hypothetical protein